MNPFELHGPAYLTFYVCAVTAGAMIAITVRHALLSGRDNTVSAASVAAQLDPYEAAYLAGGADRAFASACGALARHKLLCVNTVTRTLSLGDNPNRPRLHDLEEAILRDADREAIAISRASQRVSSNIARIHERLVERGLVVAPDVKNTASFIPWLLFMGVVLIFALPKIAMAEAEQRPHGYLVALFVICMCLSIGFCKSVRNTKKGDEVSRCLTETNSALRLTAATNPLGLSLRDMAMAYGIFGAVALAGDPFADALQGLRAMRVSGSSGGGGGCGSSCGGGGCGGGGCGGCGG